MAAAPAPIDLDTFSWGRVIAKYESKDEKGITSLIDATEFPKDAVSLPLVGYPFGRPIEPIVENQNGRGDIPVRLQLVGNTVQVTFLLSELHPRIVPKVKIDQPSQYIFRTQWMTRQKEMKQTFPDVIVDTSAFARSAPYPKDMKMEDISDVTDKDLDPSLFEFYLTDKVTKPEWIPKDKRLKDYYESTNGQTVMTTAERRFAADGKTFQSIRIPGRYAHQQWSANCSAPYFDFSIVPIRQEFEYENFFSLSEERTIIFHSLTFEFNKDKLPDDVKTWMLDMYNNVEVRAAHQYAKYIEPEVQRRLPMTRFWSDEDLPIDESLKPDAKSSEDESDTSCPIPLDIEKLDDYFNEMGQAIYYQFAEDSEEKEQGEADGGVDDDEDDDKDDDEDDGEEDGEEDDQEEEEEDTNHDDDKDEADEEDEEDEKYSDFIDQLFRHISEVSERLRKLLEQRCKYALKFAEVRATLKTDDLTKQMQKLNTV